MSKFSPNDHRGNIPSTLEKVYLGLVGVSGSLTILVLPLELKSSHRAEAQN